MVLLAFLLWSLVEWGAEGWTVPILTSLWHVWASPWAFTSQRPDLRTVCRWTSACHTILDLAVQVEAKGTEIQWLNHMQVTWRLLALEDSQSYQGSRINCIFQLCPPRGLCLLSLMSYHANFSHASNESWRCCETAAPSHLILASLTESRPCDSNTLEL